MPKREICGFLEGAIRLFAYFGEEQTVSSFGFPHPAQRPSITDVKFVSVRALFVADTGKQEPSVIHAELLPIWLDLGARNRRTTKL